MQIGVDTVPVLIGPVSYLLLSKPAKGVEKSFTTLSLLGQILPIYMYNSNHFAHIIFFFFFHDPAHMRHQWVRNQQGSDRRAQGGWSFMDPVR